MEPTWCQGFPRDNTLVQLLDVSQATNEPIIHDAYGLDKTYAELLGDVVETRDRIRKAVPASSLDRHGMLREAAPYTGFLGLSGYEFIVAFFAARALGGACMPFGAGILPQEAHSFLARSKACVLLVGGHKLERGQQINEYSQQHGHGFQLVRISTDAPPVAIGSIAIDDSVQLDGGGPGFVIFTSGTTGPPKGAVLPRRWCLFEGPAEPGSATISERPPHWIGGAYPMLESTLIGRHVYILKNAPPVSAIWDTFRDHRIDHMAFTPGLLRAMKQDYQDRICKLPAAEHRLYLQGIRNLKTLWQGGGMPSVSMLDFWRDLVGKPVAMRYGSTELGGTVTGHDGSSKIKYSVGTPFPGIEIKLSNGDSGAILVRSPHMMTHYIGDEHGPKDNLDSEGYLESGDTGHLQDGELIYDGRASNEYIFFNGYRIPILPLEHALCDLGYISEGYVVAVPDHESNEICGALVRLRKTGSDEKVDLARIRSDLSEDHAAFTLPVVLRILDDGEEVPVTVSQKPMRKQAARKFFLTDDYWSPENPTPGVEYVDPKPTNQEAKTRRIWDWAGLQR
ncbi:AMP-dependent synthetase/ligase [Metarhizium album ARSEF 1941]|uniref:AMP-dependent synthetase/ligase n=1 Tax=Metarhizium album (strain ARSEF 1941) TaxID=1081103 RepID=A0A0B2WTG3_METAS|nr:AMP-dependent synthetase/ligase [Metarhizium album ARSEF 1941]KHN97323.1 AMP-dependent synthetase/ligase [Metarhizium album ARSEF 1941]